MAGVPGWSPGQTIESPPHGKPVTWRKIVSSARNGPTADGPWDASARYEPAGPTACPRSGRSAVGRPDRLPASDRWPRFGLPRRRPRPAGCADIQTFWSFRPPKLPGRPLPRPAPGSRLPGGKEAASGPPRWKLHTVSVVPPGGPSPRRPHRPCRGTAGSRINSIRSGRCPHARLGGTGKSGSPESWHPSDGGFPCDTSLTKRSPPDCVILVLHGRTHFAYLSSSPSLL